MISVIHVTCLFQVYSTQARTRCRRGWLSKDLLRDVLGPGCHFILDHFFAILILQGCLLAVEAPFPLILLVQALSGPLIPSSKIV